MHRRDRRTERRSERDVSLSDLVRRDFEQLDRRTTLRTTWAVEQLILIQSIEGHAHEGHSVFNRVKFPNATMDDITQALRLDPAAVTEDRQDLIDDIVEYVDRALEGVEQPALVNAAGRPLLEMSTLRFLQVDPKDVLRGLYLGGLRDDADVRHATEQERGVVIGGGRCYHVDFAAVRREGLNGYELAKGEWAGKIEELRGKGVIVDSGSGERPEVSYEYIRHRRGPGASDDAAIVGAGLLWGLGVAVGVFLADAIDTLEKYVPVYSEQDGDLAKRIGAEMTDLNISDEDVRKLTFVGAVPEALTDEVPDSSLRHLLDVDRGLDLCSAESHLLTTMGVPTPRIGLSHERLDSLKFYDYVRRRIDEA